MVTLKNNFGVEPDKDSIVMNATEAAPNDGKSSGHPKAILICRRNSHPFQARTLILNTPAKIGRSIARARPSSYNGIFDCKVLSRNHATIWYDYDTGKFMIQDTKSSNGTFVNNQRLSKGGESSLPREFFSRDVIQFGVDVHESQRKGFEESDNSEDNSHIVTHGCIVATVRLFHPNGKESESDQLQITKNVVTSVPQEKICKLEFIIHEAHQRERRLHDKLEELQLIIGKLETACQETLTNRFEETRLLSKIENLEKQTKVMSRVMSGNSGKGSEKIESEIKQLLVDIEKVQSVAREIQERQHRKLLESEQKLVEAQRVASNLELEVIALREQASLTELHLQEMGAKCTAYCQTIDILKSNYHAQIELTQKLEARLPKFDEFEENNELKKKFPEVRDSEKCKLICNETDDDATNKEKENQANIWERLKNFEDFDVIDEEDFMKENDKTEWIMSQLENFLTNVERSQIKIEKLCIRNHALSLEIESAKTTVEEFDKTEKNIEEEIFKQSGLPKISNEKVTELEIELEENEDLLNQARCKQKDSEDKCSKLRCDLDESIKRCEKVIIYFRNLKGLLKNHLKGYEECKAVSVEEIKNSRRDNSEKLDILDNCKKVNFQETQTPSVHLKSSSTNTEIIFPENFGGESSENKLTLVKTFASTKDLVRDQDSVVTSDISTVKPTEGFQFVGNLVLETSTTEQSKCGEIEWTSNNIGTWEKIQKIQHVLTHNLRNDDPLIALPVNEMRTLMDSLTEDLVYLLLREQQINKDKQSLREKLNKSVSQNDIYAIGLDGHLKTMILVSLTAVAVFFIYTLLL